MMIMVTVIVGNLMAIDHLSLPVVSVHVGVVCV